MAGTGLWLRIFAALLVAIIIPILGIAVLGAVVGVLGDVVGPVVAAVGIVAALVVWAAVLAAVYARVLADDLRTLRTLAERGEREAPEELGRAYRQVAGALDERDRQLAILAEGTGSVPIDESPVRVVDAIVDLVRAVMGDATWTFAVLATSRPELLAPGIYGSAAGAGINPPDDLAQWTSVRLAETGVPAARLEGPWGAFVAVSVRADDRLSGILVAPWEGRAAPTPAELALVTLVGQHAATALDHSILYATVRTQADDLNRLATVQADFLRGVTHDLQTPLTSIGALAGELGADATLSPAARADLDSIEHQANRLRRMVGQLLVASRLEAGAVTPKQDVFAVRPIIDRTWSALRDDRPFRLTESGEPYLAVGDPDRFEQVLWAALDNAVKYSPPDSPIEVIVAFDDGSVRVAIRDEGSGMDDETHARAFEQFYRSDDARRLAPDGSGIGLYAARGLMEAMGGRIEIDSRLGSGSTVTLTLPAERAEAGSD